jgi:hypothetical protein
MGHREMNMATLNIWAILAAAVSAFLLGGIWYAPFALGKLWIKANGFASGDVPSAGPKVFAITFLLT